MFNSNRVLINAFVIHARTAYREAFPRLDVRYQTALEGAIRTALSALRNCDCPYHDLEHTLLVTDAGIAILRGRSLLRGDLTPSDWLQAVVGMLYHDLGYRRGLLRDDRPGEYLIDANGDCVTPPPNSSDASLTAYHVSRGSLFVLERFANDPLIDAETVASYIEMTRFPVPEDSAYQATDTLAGLVRAADLIGQMGDPAYRMKQVRLFAEMQENGEARRLGYQNPAQLRAGFCDFFYRQVYPYLGDALQYLKLTQEGEQWIANLFHHVHADQAEASGKHGAADLEEFVVRANRSGDAQSGLHMAVNNP